MKWCLCFRVSKASKDESPLVDMRNDIEASKGIGAEHAAEDNEAKQNGVSNFSPTAKTVVDDGSCAVEVEKHPGNKQPTRVMVSDVDSIPVTRTNKSINGRVDTNESGVLYARERENVPLQDKSASSHDMSGNSEAGGNTSIKIRDSTEQSKPSANATRRILNTPEVASTASYSDVIQVENIKAPIYVADGAAPSVFTEIEPTLGNVNENDVSKTILSMKNSASDEAIKYKNTVLSENAIKVPLNKGYESNDEHAEDQTSEYKKWNLYGEEHVEIDYKGEYTPPKLSYTTEVLDDEPIYAVAPSAHRNTNYRASVVMRPTDSISGGVHGSRKGSDVNQVATTTSADSFPGKEPKVNLSEPKARPPPLKRGSARIPIKRKAANLYSQNRTKADIKPTPETALKLLEKILTLDESKWKEIMKIQSELSAMVAKYPEVVSACDSSSLVPAVRRMATYANSSRSNLSHSGITCLGDLYKAQGLMLNQPLPDVLDVCVRKASSGSPEFICTVANSALAKICVSSSDAKACAILLKLYKTYVSCVFSVTPNRNKSASLTILNCMLILLNSMGPNVGKHKMLPDIFDMVINAIKAGNIDVRRAGKMLIGQINEHVDCLKLLNSMRKGDDAKRLISASLSRYDKEEKDNYLRKLTTDVVQ
ncbi:hypothetical protein, conserved [Babesia ovata]|uniref:TOG domain-containing protein n=1 Tax=Babesia ovata TaxID=189622 RepID=A0A2H6KEJ5_9APIC|nr:uncharacterized protein BOVATA_029130 [Babesia ovata]GBE61420.1 hypothetical protein, conserved [Babesia ovata]